MKYDVVDFVAIVDILPPSTRFGLRVVGERGMTDRPSVSQRRICADQKIRKKSGMMSTSS